VVVLPENERCCSPSGSVARTIPISKFLDPTPRLFSFNNPYGSCPTCTGFGATLEYDPALIVPVASTLVEGGRGRSVGEAALQAVPHEAARAREGEGCVRDGALEELPRRSAMR
jgi:excinuclease UvrABC ATPase subunit